MINRYRVKLFKEGKRVDTLVLSKRITAVSYKKACNSIIHYGLGFIPDIVKYVENPYRSINTSLPDATVKFTIDQDEYQLEVRKK